MRWSIDPQNPRRVNIEGLLSNLGAREGDGDTKLNLPTSTNTIKEPLSDVVRFEADSNYSKVVFANRPPEAAWQQWLAASQPLILTDQYAPVDWLMGEVFRRRPMGKDESVR